MILKMDFSGSGGDANKLIFVIWPKCQRRQVLGWGGEGISLISWCLCV